jgi:hypothetical protein
LPRQRQPNRIGTLGLSKRDNLALQGAEGARERCGAMRSGQADQTLKTKAVTDRELLTNHAAV